MTQSILMRVLFCKIHCPLFFCFCKPSAARLYTPGPLKLKNTPHVPSTVVSVTDTSDQLSGENIEAKPKPETLDGKQQQAQNQNILRSCIRKASSESGSSKEAEKKRVQWVDNLGNELAETREFESSEAGDTDSEEENRGCVCVIL